MARKQREVRNIVGRGSTAGAGEAMSVPRIIGGTLGGRKLIYALAQERTRPMKDRTREAVFNLIGPSARGKHAIDLFAGTGALGFEALSRGAARATFIEQHFPTAAVIRQNAAELGVTNQTNVHSASAFIWAQEEGLDQVMPWLVFCSPPYAFYLERREAMLALIGTLLARAPGESIFVVEADRRFEINQLPDAERWDVREYPPAVVAIYRK
ncbi:MAG: RsmD family RNA methyltransferase [Pirellulales bacterium]